MNLPAYYNAKDLLGGLSSLIAAFAEEHDFVPTRRGRLLMAMLLLASTAMLLDEDKPSPELRRKLTSFFSSCLSKKDGAEEFFHDLLGVRIGDQADFKVILDVAVN